ncbi:MAG: hypothetical protein AB1611_05320 [bacterium]
MKCIISFCAEAVIIDSRTNNVSAFNLLEELHSPSFPVFIPRILFFALLERDDSDLNRYDLTLKVNNNEQLLLEVPTSADFQDPNKTRNRLIIEIGGLAIPSAGELGFTLIHAEQTVCSYSVKVMQIGKPQVKKIE